MATYYDRGRFRGREAKNIVFDGVNLNDYFEVTSLGFDALPSITAVTTDIPGKPGEYYFSRNIGTRTGTLQLSALADDSSPMSVIEKWRELGPLINKSEPRPLYLGNDKYINVMITGETPLEFFGERGLVELKLTAYDPYFHGKTHTVPLVTGDNTFRVLSQCEVWPKISITGAQAPLRVRRKSTYDEVRVPTVGSAKIEIDMENMKVYSGGNYVPVDIQYTDFFSLSPGEVETINLSSGTGTLEYEELS